MNQFDGASQATEKADQVFERIGPVNGLQVNLLNQCRLAFESQDCARAIALAERAIELASEFKDDATLMRAYRLLAKRFQAKDYYKEALFYHEKYMSIQEDLYKLQRSRQNMDMEIRHAIREKQKEIAQLTKDKEYQAQLLQKTEQIARQNDELVRVNDDLRQFAYIASHDLKEPLRMIGSFTQVIQKIANPHLSEKDKEYFQYVSEGVKRMHNLLDGLLRYTTVHNSQDEITDIALNDIISLSMANLKIRIVETKATIERGELPIVKGTQQLMVQLFQNLIANAIKFVKPGVQPYIKIHAEETEDAVAIHVTDNGIGISEENQAKIFEIFKRLHHHSEYEGTGIGLAICQKIANRMGGTIVVKSVLGSGATFTLVLPKA